MDITGLVISSVGTVASIVSICLSCYWWKKTYKEVKFSQTERKLYSTKLSDEHAFVKIRDLATTLSNIDPDFAGSHFTKDGGAANDIITALTNYIVNIKKDSIKRSN